MNKEEMINNYLTLETQVKEALNKITLNQNNILETMQVYKEQLTGNELEVKEPLNNKGLSKDHISSIVDNYKALTLSNDDLSIITSVINKKGLNSNQVNIVFKNVNNYINKGNSILNIKTYLISSINRYYEEHIKYKDNL